MSGDEDDGDEEMNDNEQVPQPAPTQQPQAPKRAIDDDGWEVVTSKRKGR